MKNHIKKSSRNKNDIELFNEKNFIATGGFDNCINILETHSGISKHSFSHPNSQVNKLCFTPDTNFLAAAGFKHVKLYDLNSVSKNPVISYNCSHRNVVSVNFHPKLQYMFTAGEEGHIKIWDTRTNYEVIKTVFDVNTQINDAVQHNNQIVIYAVDVNGILNVSDMLTRKTFHCVPDNRNRFESIGICHFLNRLAVGSTSGFVTIYDITDALHPGEIKKFKAHNNYIIKCEYSPNTEFLATGSADANTGIWYTKDDDYTNVYILKNLSDGWVWDLKFSMDSSFIFSACSDKFIRLWNLNDGLETKTYCVHKRGILAIDLLD